MQSPPQIVPAAWAEYRASAGHRAHVGREDVVCGDCHAYEKEGFVNPGSAPCRRCHDAEAKHGHGGVETERSDCLTCHAFAPSATLRA